ncbi:MAG: helix-turn-helix domain-containing protein [Saprospiraceae bacterium]
MYTSKEFKKRVNKIIKANLLNPNLKDEFIANEMGVSRMYIHRKLKTYYKMNARELITKKKITFAKDQLLQTDLPITFIAKMVHFHDMSHFSKTFKKWTGYTPTGYRKLID